eukprot:11212255-Lingulodinium_polyedra.AAC.1
MENARKRASNAQREKRRNAHMGRIATQRVPNTAQQRVKRALRRLNPAHTARARARGHHANTNAWRAHGARARA